MSAAAAKTRPYSGPQKRVRAPSLLQMEAVECGAAALGIVLGYHGRFVPLEQLREDCGISRDGSKASNIVKAGEAYGLKMQGMRKSAASLPELPLPMIVFWQYRHFLVVEGFSRSKVFLNDPASGPRAVSWDEFIKGFSMVVLTCVPTPEFKKGGSRHRLLPALTRRLKGAGWGLLFAVLAGLALTVPNLATPTFSRIFVDEYLVDGLTGWAKPLLWIMALTCLVMGLLTFLQQRCFLRLETVKALEGSGALLDHLLSLPSKFFAQRYAGDITVRVALINKVAQLIGGQLATNFIGLISTVFFALLLMQYSLELGLLVVATGLLNLVALRYISRKRKDLNMHMLMSQGKLLGVSMNGLQMMETLKAGGAENDFFVRWSNAQADAINAQQKFGALSRVLSAIPPLLSQITSAVVLGVGGYLIINGQMTAGMLLAFQGLMQQFLTPLNNLVNLGGQLQELDGDMARIEDVLRYKPADGDQTEPIAQGHQTGKLSGRLELKGITFGYSPLADPLIEGFDLSLRPGSRVALVGPSGSGKSTVARLVAGLNRPWKGEILLDGKPRAHWPKPLIQSSLASVDQSVMLFEGTIRDNLTLWDPTVQDKDLVKACKDACIHDEITGRPGGYKAYVAERGLNFSGGQRQRLEIARSLVQGATLQILDEATAALDPITEKTIDRNLRRRGMTCLIVAHRLSTIRDCDEIIVLEKGKVVQRGRHEELMQQEGLYATLIHDD